MDYGPVPHLKGALQQRTKGQNTQEVGLALCQDLKAIQLVSKSQLAEKFVNLFTGLLCPHLELTCHTKFVL